MVNSLKTEPFTVNYLLFTNYPMNPPRKILIFENSFILANYMLKLWQTIAKEAIGDHNQFNVALSGGRTPAEFYCRLSSIEDDALWKKTHLFLGDERFVDSQDKENNFKMIKSSLIDYIRLPWSNMHSIPTDVENPAVAAEHLKHQLFAHFAYQRKPLPSFDLILLGVGEDGHTASLFPQMPELDNPNAVTLPVSLPHLKHERVTIGLPIINNARYVIFLVLGPTKADIMQKILEENHECPTSRVNPANGELIFLLDKGAAGKLSKSFIFEHQQDALSLTQE